MIGNAIQSVRQVAAQHAPDLAAAGGKYTGKGLSDWLLGLVGTILGALIAARSLGHYAQRDYGGMISCIAGGVLVGMFCWFPQESIDFLQWLIGKFFGK